jgi:hypothetical protein
VTTASTAPARRGQRRAQRGRPRWRRSGAVRRGGARSDACPSPPRSARRDACRSTCSRSTRRAAAARTAGARPPWAEHTTPPWIAYARQASPLLRRALHGRAGRGWRGTAMGSPGADRADGSGGARPRRRRSAGSVQQSVHLPRREATSPRNAGGISRVPSSRRLSSWDVHLVSTAKTSSGPNDDVIDAAVDRITAREAEHAGDEAFVARPGVKSSASKPRRVLTVRAPTSTPSRRHITPTAEP